MEMLRKSFLGSIKAMSLMVETRDPYTSGHQKKVSSLALAIAAEMELDDNTRNAIRIAGLLHDIGKIQIPSEILNKPGKLTPLEYSFIEVHPQAGYDIVKTIEFPWPIAKIILQHHERLDGSGYPKKIKGEEILLEAKILAVADIVVALISHRPYQPAITIDEAIAEISRNRDSLFDAAVVDACSKLFKEKKFELS
jgi:putative nucleotidyltransferase with HDIG domain